MCLLYIFLCYFTSVNVIINKKLLFILRKHDISIGICCKFLILWNWDLGAVWMVQSVPFLIRIGRNGSKREYCRSNKSRTLIGWFRTDSGSQHLHPSFVLLKITEVPPSPYPFGRTRLGRTDGIQECRLRHTRSARLSPRSLPQWQPSNASLPRQAPSDPSSSASQCSSTLPLPGAPRPCYRSLGSSESIHGPSHGLPRRLGFFDQANS